MDQLVNDLSYAMIDMDRISDLGLKHDSHFPARLISPSTAASNSAGHIPGTSECSSSRRLLSQQSSKDNPKCGVSNSHQSNELKIKSTSSSGKSKSFKPVLRSASILLSKKLILSDSESDDTEKQDGLTGNQRGAIGGLGADGMRNVPRLFGDFNCSSLSRRHRVKKSRKKKEVKEERTFGQLFLGQNSFAQYFGKRKRSANPANHSNSICTDDINVPPSGISHSEELKTGGPNDQMDCDSPSCDSSSLSESNCDSDHFAEADDEQSDFYEFISRSNKSLSKPLSPFFSECEPLSCQNKYSPSIPIPSNPFASIPPTPSSSYNSLTGASSSILWKRRRRNN